MKKLTTCLLFLLCLSAQAQVNLVPAPQKVNTMSGHYRLPEKTTIAYSTEALKPAAEYLQLCLQRYAKVNANLAKGKQGDIRITTTRRMAKNGYQLNIHTGGIDIYGANYSGTLSAIATLNQLLLQSKADGSLQRMRISDAPRFDWRGFHLDVSRHFFTVDEVKEIIDLMALYKLNRFHWHLTDDQGWRIEIKKYPLLTEKGAWRRYNNQDSACLRLAAREDNPDLLIPKKNTRVENGDTLYGGFYTQAQIRDVVAYARQRGIEIVPEIDMPGHFLSAIENYEGLSCFPAAGWGEVFTTPLCPGKQKVLDFCKDIWTEVFALFPYEYVHVGGDEVRKDTWKACPDCQQRIKANGLKNEEELQSWFIHQMEAFINKNGRKMMGWDEILEGGLSKTATVTWWRTWVPNAPNEITAQGNRVIFCPGAPMYFSQAEEKTSMRSIYEYDAEMMKGLNAKQQQRVMGVQGNMWCEYIPTRERVLFQYFPRILALSELAWTQPEQKDYDQFYSRLPKQFAMLHQLNVPFRTPSLDGVYHVNAFTSKGTMAVTCADPLATVRYTTDGSFPNQQSPLYTQPIPLDETTHFMLRTFAPNGRQGEILKADFIKQGLLEPVETDAQLTPGLKAAWYNYRGETCADIHKVKFNGNYEVADVVIPDSVKGNIGLIITGYLQVPTDGVYTFSLMSDDGSWLKLDGNMVVDNNQPQSPHEEVSQQALKAGLHKLEVRYFDSNGGMLRLWVFDPQGKKLKPADIYLR